MALKDWKKIGINRWRKGGTIIQISNNLYSAFANGGWEVITKHERTNYYYDDKLLKTKSAALKYAKKYMKAH